MSLGSRLHICLPFLLLLCSSCSLLKKKPESDLQLYTAKAAELSPEEAQELLKEVGENWLYGPGLGSTVIQAGAVIAFPPYALVLLGNSALELSGYQRVGAADLIPGAPGEAVVSLYDSVVSVPGRISSQVAQEDFRSPEVANERINRVLRRNSATAADDYLVMIE